MVSALWTACAENDVERIGQLLNEPVVDLEIKDAEGVTPLILAAKNGYVDIVRILLDRGANPLNASAHGIPATHTTDPTILHMLSSAAAVRTMPAPVPADVVLVPRQDGSSPGHEHPQQQPNMAHPYWAPPPPSMYGYYPPIAHGLPPPPTGPDGAPLAYYPPPGAEPVGPYPPLPPHQQPPQPHNGAQGPGNLPPPEVARLIPCRFFPACRYGASCMFAHPTQQGPPAPSPQYGYPGAPAPPPHASYGMPYDPSMAPPPTFGPGGYYPAPFPPPAHMDLSSPHGPGSPPGAYPPPSSAYPAPGPMSPTYSNGIPSQGMYPPPVPAPHEPPFQVVPPPQQAPAPLPAPQQASPPGEQPTAPQLNGGPPSGEYAAPPISHGPPTGPRGDGPGHHRRGSARRPSFGGSRKPPCIFYPTGRCRNGDECRFPHIMPGQEQQVGNGNHPNGNFTGGRGGHRPRFSVSNGAQASGFAAIEEKMDNMSIRDSAPARPNGYVRGGGPGGFASKRVGAPGPVPPVNTKYAQRLPGADDFPSLGGSNTPSPARSPGLNGPTAAQVLQAPPPKKDTYRNDAPQVNGDATAELVPVAPITNGVHVSATIPAKLPVSFAAIATGAVSAASEAPSQVSVSA